ncbi:MAG: HEAT repeat domain-containing protein [Massilia sp.]
MIDIGVDQDGESLRMLLAQSLRAYPIDSLHLFLDDKNAIVRTTAARQVQIQGSEKSFNFAIGLLGDKRAFVREIGVFILGQHGTPNYPYKAESVPLITERLVSDKSSAVRAAAAAALGHLKAVDALDALIGAAWDKSAEVRSCVAFALTGMKRRARAREILQMLKNDESAEVRFWAGD